ncbi:sulfotransferase domain-containing protein [Blastococcus colisei]|uniref:Sulfotransferase domain-containing protein n=1 Tax=Blastococcus colisei TaxID=1564162 RepID=A0A543P0D0_9ACTN|nr:sulfotransferase [Blastococcus colisei]TQN37562.1 sulfotransferase domain-containing protein [Blastococcus colisei]
MTTRSAHRPAASVDAGPRASVPTVLFLGGLGRSGTTVLERVLGELPGTCSAGELVHLWQRSVLDDETCGCGEPFSRCRFWAQVGDRAFGGWDRSLAERMLELRSRVDRTRHVPLLALPRLPGRRRRAEHAEYVDVCTRLYRAIAEVSGCPVVIDSSKHSSLAFCVRRAPGIDLRVVHVVRDSRGVAYSWTKEVLRPESGAAEDLMHRYSPAGSSALWIGHNLFFALLARLGTRTRLLRYEDFVAEPRRRTGELAEFAGLPDTQEVTAFVDDSTVSLTPSHTVAGNPVRFRNGPMTLRRDDAWRERLPRRRRALVGLMTFPLLVRYGYVRPSGGRRAR